MKNETPKVSVIIPVYRAKKHIQKTLDCLQSQTLRDLEFIFVDDKGMDGTFEKVQVAALSDPRIVCLENDQNRGPGASRNKGIESARGEFIAFMDADDYASLDFYEKLYKKAKKENALVVKSRTLTVHPNGKTEATSLNNFIKKQLMKMPDSMLNLWSYEHSAGIYSRQLVMDTNARNHESARRGEDTCFLMKLMLHVKPSQFAMEEDAIYYYVQHNESITHLPHDARILKHILEGSVYKVDFLIDKTANVECAKYLHIFIDSRLKLVINEEWDDSVTKSDIAKYIDYFAAAVKTWRRDNIATYKEGAYTAALRAMHYDAHIYYSTCKWYLQHLNNNIIISNQKKEIDELRLQLGKTSNFSVVSLENDSLMKALCYIFILKKIKRKLFVSRIKRFFTFGKRKQNYQEKIAECKRKLRKYKMLVKELNVKF